MMLVNAKQDIASQQAVLLKALLRAADHLGCTSKVIAAIIGVSDATMSRLKAGTAMLEGKSVELAILFVRLFRSLDSLVGGDVALARAWLNNPNTALGGVPMAQLRSITGLVDVIAYLDSRRAPL